MEEKKAPKLFEGGDVNVHYMLMPLTAEETNAGGEYLGVRYAVEHKDRWINVDHLIFELQTYDRGYTTVRIHGRTYGIYQDILEGDLNTRLFIGKYIGTAREDDIGGLQTMEMTPKNLYTWKELIDLGVVTDSASVTIDYSKLIDKDGKKCLIGNSVTGGVRLLVPSATTKGVGITSISSNAKEEDWSKSNFPARFIGEVILPEGLTTIGVAAFPKLGRSVVRHQVSVKVPSTLETIGKQAFYGAKVEKISASEPFTFKNADKLKTIEESAFENCGELSVIHFGSSLKVVKAKAFANCTKLQVHFRNSVEDIAEDACLMAGDVEYTPRVKEGEEVPDIVAKAPFQAKLWNGKTGYTPGFYKKPTVYPTPGTPTIIPGTSSGGEVDPERTPLDLSGVLNQISGLNGVADKISAPK